MPKLFDYTETDPKTQESKTRHGLFTKIGTMLTYTAVGLKDPGRLAEIQAQNARAEQEFEMFRKKMEQSRIENERAAQFDEIQRKFLEQNMGGGSGGVNGTMSSSQFIPSVHIGKDGRLSTRMIINPQYSNALALKLAIDKSKLPTSDMRNLGKATEQARVLFEDIKSQSEGLSGGYSGIKENLKSIINRGKGASADYKLYNDNLPASSVALYRALTGDTRLSDADAQARAYPMLWRPDEHTDVRERKNSFIERMLQAREEILSSDDFDKDDSGNPVISWETLIRKAKEMDVKSPESNGGFQTFKVGGKTYNIPKDKIDAFKKAKGIK